MKKVIIIKILIFSLLIVFSCKKKQVKVDPKLIIGKWQVYISKAEKAKLKTGMQKLFFVFKKDGTGVFYYYNVDFKSGNQYARKDKEFKYEVYKKDIKIIWLEKKQTVIWPYSLKENNTFLLLSDPTPGYAITYALQRVKNQEE